MYHFIRGILVFLLAAGCGPAHASLLSDDSISYSVDLTTSSGNFISTSGTFSPGADVYCFDFSIFGPCPPGPLFDTDPLDNINGDNDLFLLFNAEGQTISMLIADAVAFVPEFLTATLTFSDIGWGGTNGQIVGGEVCGVGLAGCGPDSGFEAEFFADAVSIEIDSFLAVFASSSGSLSGLGYITVDLEVEPIPTPATMPLIAIALAGLGWSRRKKT